MSRSIIITPDFLAKIRTTGHLAEAAARLKPLAAYPRLPLMSTWALVCEECLDTEFPPEQYERYVAELFRRGITPPELEEMRLFAWDTAGWLNFEKMLWDWCSLDENDIQRAIQWQLADKEIPRAEADRRLRYLAHYTGGIHQPTPPPTPQPKLSH